MVSAALTPGTGGALLVGLLATAVVAMMVGAWIWGLVDSLSWPDWAYRRVRVSRTAWAVGYVVLTPLPLIVYVLWLRGHLERATTEGPRRPILTVPTRQRPRPADSISTAPGTATGVPLIDLRAGMATIDLRGAALVECTSCRRLAAPGASHCRNCSAPLPHYASRRALTSG